jgi:hypothetical protein
MALTDAEARYATKRGTDYKLVEGERLHLASYFVVGAHRSGQRRPHVFR